ncbi:hypothetical protein C8F04DRAFT_454853 [Mycena alexandri]|uniref:F-box domain-containing protein n=1 Tax=Mycena alexandri TaxID=1745969 RepID=A0AAD6XI01_9AGAR|nr:hypothetical protein C8F04DRAFT_454853 [Mycena alexandri]
MVNQSGDQLKPIMPSGKTVETLRTKMKSSQSESSSPLPLSDSLAGNAERRPSAALPPSLPIPELWEHILGCVESDSDLRSCSLVCRALSPASQDLLFQGICFVQDDSGGPEPPPTWHRLRVIFQESPHLTCHVRRIEIFDEDALEFICSLDLPRLQQVEICCVRETHPDPSKIAAVQTLVSLPTVRRIVIGGYMRNPNLIPIILAEASHIVSLAFWVTYASDF